jgi:pyrroline-5-carboxylate reductase
MKELRESEELFHDKFLISLVAGKQLTRDIDWDYPAARVLPNLNAAVCESVSAYAVNDHCDFRHVDAIVRIFGEVGKVMPIEEKHFDTIFALSGCGPAFVYLFINSIAQAAVKYGIDKQTATEIAAAMLKGSATMLQESGYHPHELIDSVCSPGGMTIEAIHSLYCNAFEGIIMNAMEKAILKAKKL